MIEFAKKLNKINQYLNYQFINIDLLKVALTHSSCKETNNQRLEFLGDAILNSIIANHLYVLMPTATEGDLTRMRSVLVKEDPLVCIAKKLLIQDYILLGPGEQKTGGYNKDSILAGTLEAIIGAIYLDSDFVKVTNVVMNWYLECNFYKELINKKQLPTINCKDPKTILQETLQSKSMELPVYKVIKITGKPHNQKFTVQCLVPGIDLLDNDICGVGTSRKKAEQNVAKKILKILKF